MAARRAKRIKLDGSVLLLQSPATTKQLTRLAKGSLCALAILWTTEQHPAALRPSQRVVESDPESDEEEEVEEELKAVYEVMRDQASLGKSRVVERIQKDWSDGFTYRQLAQLDVQYLNDRPSYRSWTAYQLQYDASSVRYPTSAELTTRLRTALAPYHPHHLYIDSMSTLTVIRIQILPLPLSPLPPAITILQFPSSPFILLHTVPSSLAPILSQCLCATLSTPPAQELKELQLKGKDWRGMRDLLKGRMSSGGMTKFRMGKGEGGGPLVPEERRVVVDDSKGEEYAEGEGKYIVKDDNELKLARDREVGQVFGREDLPVLSHLDYEVSLPYPTIDEDEPTPPPFLLHFEGTHVLQGLKALVEQGYADGGLPNWLGSVAREGRNILQVPLSST